MLLEVAAHVLAIHDLPIVFSAKDAEFHVQPKKEPLRKREFSIIPFG